MLILSIQSARDIRGEKSFHIIGAGKVGQAFAAILQRSGWQLSAVCSSHHADRIVWQSGTGVAVRSVGELPFADVVLVTTRDDVIETAAASWRRVRGWTSG